jgi:predicted TIM-barrel fold metal-dependent hydrolase
MTATASQTTDRPSGVGRHLVVGPGPIDTDVHEMMPSAQVDELVPYLPPQWARYVTEFGFKGYSGAVPWSRSPTRNRAEWLVGGAAMGSNPLKTAEDIFDKMGISVGILNNAYHVPAAMPGAYELAAALAHAYNDYLAENWLAKDARFAGSVYVVPDDAEEAAREIDRVGGHPQIVQVLLPVVVDRQLGHRRYRPIFEAAVRNDLVIAYHHVLDTKCAFGYPNYFSEWHTTALPDAMMCQVASLLFNGLFDSFPSLKVCCLESGFSWMPGLMFRADRQRLQFRDEVPWVKRKPSELLRDHVRLATQPMEDFTSRQLLQVIDLMGSEEMIMFSSDYPHHDADVPARALPAGIPDSLQTKIMRENALATYPKLKAM